MMVGARNNNLCSYLIALEGWRRGLTLTFDSRKVKRAGIHAPGRVFTLSSDQRTHTFYKAKGDSVSSEAIRIGTNKELTKSWLEKHGVPVPEGKRFSSDATDEEIINYAESLGFPVVIKPTRGTRGHGVISNIYHLDFLKKAIHYVRSELNSKDVIVEKHVTGEEYRIFVIEDEVIAVLNRVPANVTGDGIHTIKQLINLKNRRRRRNPRLSSCLIKVDFEIKNLLKKKGLTLDYVPDKGERIFLRKKSNISMGGDSIEITEEFPEEIKQVAIDAIKALPGLAHAGVDVIVNIDPVTKKPMGYVLEINAVPQIGSLVFPMRGQARDIPGAIVDYYFPETIDKKNYNPRLYFDFGEVLRPLRNKVASEVTVIPVPTDIEVAKVYIVTGKVQGVNYRRWIRRKAIEADLHGYIQNQTDGSVVIMVAGSKVAVSNFKQICLEGPPKAVVNNLTEKEWHKSVKVGFEIKATPKRKKRVVKKQVKQKPLTRKQMIKNRLKRLLRRR